ncbi:MAG: hypothetical protein ACUVUR_02245 [bacterium]
MRFNWIDVLSVGVVSIGAGVQFLRATKDFSRILYETLLLIAALVTAVRMYTTVQRLFGLSAAGSFAGLFLFFMLVALLIASLLNRVIYFDFGGFAYLFGLVLGVACGVVFGHAVLRTLVIGFSSTRPDLKIGIHCSWMASQVLYFGAFRELLAVLRIARYHNI